MIFLAITLSRLKHIFGDLPWFYGTGSWRTLTDGPIFRYRPRVQPRADGREAETYPAFGGALAHPPELQHSHTCTPRDIVPRDTLTQTGVLSPRPEMTTMIMITFLKVPFSDGASAKGV